MSATLSSSSIQSVDPSITASNEPLRTIVTEIVRTTQPERVILFGSRAKGTAGEESDYDLMIVLSNVQNERQVSRRIYRALLDNKIGVAVDVVVVGSQTLERNMASPYFIYREALQEGKVLYERAGS